MKPFLVVSAGTTVLDRFLVVKSPFPPFAYGHLLSMAPRNRRALVCIDNGGLGDLWCSYEAQEAKWDRLFEEHGPLWMVNHSQAAVLATMYKICHPERVAGQFDIAGVFYGTDHWIRGVAELLRVPCAKHLGPKGGFLSVLAAENARFIKRSHRPPHFCVAAASDWLVTEFWSGFAPGALCYVLGDQTPDDLHGATFVQTRGSVNHFNILRSGKLRWLLSEALEGRVPASGYSQVGYAA